VQQYLATRSRTVGLTLAYACIVPLVTRALPSMPLSEWHAMQKAPHVHRANDDTAIVLEDRIIDTRPVRHQRHTGGAAPAVLDESVTMASRMPPTARGTHVYIVQYTGPIRAAWSEAVRGYGVPRGYLPHNAMMMECADATVSKLAALPYVQWIGALLPEWKLQRDVQAFSTAAAAAARTVTITALTTSDVLHVTTAVARADGTVLAFGGAHEGYVRARLTPNGVNQLAALGEVVRIEPYVPPQLHNDVAAQAPRMNVVNVWSTHGLTGKGQIIGHADTGLDMGVMTAAMHKDFTNRIRAAFGLTGGRGGAWSDLNGHGTHTAGSILGNGSMSGGQYRGIAYEAELVHQSVGNAGNTLPGLPLDLNTLFIQTYTNGARIHSDSWGSDVYGAYDTGARQCDQFMYNQPDMLLVFSAGNSGTDADSDGVIDPDSIGSPATAKNVLTVGASENYRPGQSETYGSWWPGDFPAAPIKDDRMANPAVGNQQGIVAFSSRGPCDDQRVKPDVVAPGSWVISCRSHAKDNTGWGLTGNSNYVYMGGTSMACPLAAGAAALVRQYYAAHRGWTNPSAALVKATLINGARTLLPGQYGIGGTREILAGARPNNIEGWGHVDLESSFFPAPHGSNSFHDGESVTTGQTNQYALAVTGTNRLAVTLVWTDYPATAGSGIKLVNDLDLVVKTPDGTRLYASGLAEADRRNTVEGIDIMGLGAGVYTVSVIGHNVPYGPQPYALVLSEQPMVPRPLLMYSPTNIDLTAFVDAYDDQTVIISNVGTTPLSFQLAIRNGDYTAATSRDVNGPTSAWIDIASVGTLVTLADDGVTGLLPIGFTMPFYGSNYNDFIIAANGGIGFSTGSVKYANTRLPSAVGATPGPFVAPFWDDLNPTVSACSTMYYATPATLVVSWLNVPRYNDNMRRMTFQAVLNADGEIQFNYKQMTGTVNSATVGIQAANDTGPALQLAYNEAFIESGLSVKFTPPPPPPTWLTITPTNGVIGAHAGASVQLHGSASNLMQETYLADLVLTHNDESKSTRQVPVRLTVIPEPMATLLLLLTATAGVRRAARVTKKC